MSTEPDAYERKRALLTQRVRNLSCKRVLVDGAFLLLVTIVLTFVSTCHGQVLEGKSLFDKGDIKKAIDVLSTQLAKDSTNISALKLRSSCYIKLEDYTSAERDLVKILVIENRDLSTKYILADVYFKNDKFDRSLELYQELNYNEYYLTETKLHFNLSVVLFRLGQDDSALFYGKKYLAARSDDALAFSLVASIFFEHELLDSALYYIEKSLMLQKSAEAYYTKGRILYAKGKYYEASVELSKAILLEPKNKTYYIKRCATYAKLKDYLNAMSDCERALCIDPTCAEAYFVKALLFKDNNLIEEACRYYRLAISLDSRLKSNESSFNCKW